MGGLARRAGYIKEQRPTRPRTLIVDSGDLFFKSPSIPEYEATQMKLKAELLAESLGDMGYDCITPGETDLAFGLAYYKKLVETSGVTVVASNLKDGDSYPFPRTHIVEVDGVRFGFLGLLDPGIPLPPDTASRLSVQDPATVAQELVKDLKAQVDVVVALTHIGLRADEKLATSAGDIDMIFGGHSREILGYPNHYGNTLVYQAGKQGKYLGWVKMQATPADEDSGRRYALSALSSELQPIKIEMPEDARWKDRVDAYKKETEKLGRQTRIVEHAPTQTASDVYWGAALCGQCHARQETFWKETPHSHAYETLVKQDKHLDMECLACHTTGFQSLQARARAGQQTIVDVAGMEGVQCESCHAAGSRHSTAEIRTRARDVQTCTGCHTPVMDPGFDFAKRIEKMACPPNDPEPARTPAPGANPTATQGQVR